MSLRVLLLGGTTEAGALALALASAGLDAVYSYAGRTGAPVGQPIPTRTGGFGGAEGLAVYLRHEGFTHIIDATHPFAAQISANAVEAASEARIPLIAFERTPWTRTTGDRWTHVPDTASAVAALPEAPATVFLAIGRQGLTPFAARPQHNYLLRLVDPPDGPLSLPNATALIARGPFTTEGDRALLETRKVEIIVAKNAGGEGARAKLDAARALGLPVILIDRPALPARPVRHSVAEVMRWLHDTPPAERGV